MDPQVFKVINDIYGLLNSRSAAELTDTEMAFITGQLKTLIDLFTDPQQDDKPRKESFLGRLLP